MAMAIADAGVNLAGPHFQHVVAEVVHESLEGGVEKLVCIGNDVPTSIRAGTLCDAYPDHVYCTAGVHPQEARSVRRDALGAFKRNLRGMAVRCKGCVAIGECGLDCWSEASAPTAAQFRVFEAQVEVAKALGAPLYLHCRNAFEPLVKVLRDHGYARGLVHCFTGTAHQARVFVDMGLFMGVTGLLLDDADPRAAGVRDALSSGALPLERLLLETDAPWFPLGGDHAFSRPVDVWAIAARVAAIVGVPPEVVREATYRNTRALFEI
jgi:TatD DNase family protein